MGEGRILIVDDDDNTRNAYRELFIGYAFKTDAADGKDNAFQLLRSDHYDTVLLDLRMSNESLFSIASTIKKEFPKTCVFMMVAEASPAFIKKVMDEEIDDCLIKPLLPVQLISTVKKGILRYRLEDNNQNLVKKLEEMEKQNERWLIYDPNTGVYNGRYLSERLDVEIKRAQRHEHLLSLVICNLNNPELEDIDQDTCPRDEFTKLVKYISENVKDVDIVARYKDGLAIILPETTFEGSATLCGRLKKKMGNLFDFQENTIYDPPPVLEPDPKPLVQFGSATYPIDSHLSKRLLKIAEERLQ